MSSAELKQRESQQLDRTLAD